MADNHSVGMFLLGIAIGLFIKYVSFPPQLQVVEQYFSIIPIVLIIIAVIVFVKG